MPNAAYYITLIALTVIMEARGQPTLGQEMVAWVAVNRMGASGLDAESVLYQRGQFAVWVDYDLRMRVLRCAAWGHFPEEPWCAGIPGGVGREEWERVYTMVEGIYLGEREPPEGLEGMLNFDNPRFHPGGLPEWLRGECALIGDHLFCRKG